MASQPWTSQPRKKFWAKPLADFVGKAMGPVAAKQGFGESDIILHWPDIVGARLATASEPLRLQWTPRAPQRPPDAPIEPSTLLVRVESAFALEFQHLAPNIIERVNARLGWRCVGRIGLRQGPIGQARPRSALLVIDPKAAEQAQAAAAPIEDEALRAALTRLGAAALSDKKRI